MLVHFVKPGKSGGKMASHFNRLPGNEGVTAGIGAGVRRLVSAKRGFSVTPSETAARRVRTDSARGCINLGKGCGKAHQRDVQTLRQQRPMHLGPRADQEQLPTPALRLSGQPFKAARA